MEKKKRNRSIVYWQGFDGKDKQILKRKRLPAYVVAVFVSSVNTQITKNKLLKSFGLKNPRVVEFYPKTRDLLTQVIKTFGYPRGHQILFKIHVVDNLKEEYFSMNFST